MTEIHPKAAIWRSLHDLEDIDEEGDYCCRSKAKCPNCCLLPVLRKLMNVCDHPSMAQVFNYNSGYELGLLDVYLKGVLAQVDTTKSAEDQAKEKAFAEVRSKSSPCRHSSLGLVSINCPHSHHLA